jgi:hypothetical protein
MIYIICLKKLFSISKSYINSLKNNYNFIELIIIDNEIEIINIYNEKNYYMYFIKINEESIKNFTELLNKNIEYYNLFLVNLDSLIDYTSSSKNTDFLKNINFTIIDFSIINIYILNNFSIKNIYIPYLITNNECYNYNKVYDVGIIGIDSDHKKNIFNELKNKNINVNEIVDINDYFIFSRHKIIINLYNNKNYSILDETIFKKSLINKVILISEKTYFNYFDFLNEFVIDIQYDLIIEQTKFILANYKKINDKLYKNYDENIIKILLKNKSNIFFDNIIDKLQIEKTNEKENNIIQVREKFGFIMIRHVNSEITNNYWIESYNCIRKFYNYKIIIIDDNSNENFIKTNIELINCEVIKSEYPQRGEILPYYYLYKNNYFEKAFIIHDSVFFNKYIDFEKYDSIKFIWHFTHDWDNENNEINLLDNINANKNLIKFYNNKSMWNGCFGIQSIITMEYIEMIEKKYKIFNLLNIINSREIRMAFERIFGLLCSFETKELQKTPSIFGKIHHYLHWGYNYENYILDKSSNKIEVPLIKVWTGR